MVEKLLKPGATIKDEMKLEEFKAILLAQSVASEAAAIMDSCSMFEEDFDGMTPDMWSEQHALLGMVGEAGELLDAVKKLYIYRKTDDFDKRAACIANIDEELGDLAFYIEAFDLTDTNKFTTKLREHAMNLASHFGLIWDQVLQRNIDKLTDPEKGRYRAGTYSDSDAQARNDKSPTAAIVAQE